MGGFWEEGKRDGTDGIGIMWEFMVSGKESEGSVWSRKGKEEI
jgi:hypothetical protein